MLLYATIANHKLTKIQFSIVEFCFKVTHTQSSHTEIAKDDAKLVNIDCQFFSYLPIFN